MKTTLLFTAFILSSLLFLNGCATHPGIHELHHPVVDTPFAAGLLNPESLSSDTLSTLAAAGLASTAKNDPAGAIAALGKSLEKNPGDLTTRVALAELCEDHAEELAVKKPDAATGFYLAAAETAYPALRDPYASTQHRELLALYNESCAEAATLVFRTGRAGHQRQSIAGPLHPYILSTTTKGSGSIDPSFFDQVHAASVLEIKGFDVDNRQAGVGGALVGYRAGTEARRAANPFLSPFGMAEPLSATLSFGDGGAVQLVYHDVLVDDHVRFFGKTYPLEAEFTAALATLLSHEPPRNIGWEGMIHPDECLKYQGLYLLHEFRPDKIPVILVHGLMSSPDTWRSVVSELYADPVLRQRYQFLVYQYPTGFPIPHNAAGLRRHVREFVKKYDPRGTNPNMKRMVMIGHSMGGLLTSMQIRSGGDPVWYAIHDTAVEDMDASADHRDALRELVYFEASPYITRAVFVCAPHRGSTLANDPIGKLGSFLIDNAFQMFDSANAAVADTLSGEPSQLDDTILHHRTDGIKDLRAHSKVLEEVVKQPVGPGITYHSIVGDRGKGKPLDESSDGVVPYWSAHVDGAASESVVPASHVGATGDDETAAEIRRILLVHLGR